MIVVEQQHLLAALRQVDGQREPDRAGADDNDRVQRRLHGALVGRALVGEFERLVVALGAAHRLQPSSAFHISMSRSAVQMRGSANFVASS